MKTALPLKITTVEQAKKLLTDLHNNGEAFHPEDDAMQIMYGQEEAGFLFSRTEAVQLNKLMDDIYNLDGNNGNHKDPKFDPCEFLNDLDKGPEAKEYYVTPEDAEVGKKFMEQADVTIKITRPVTNHVNRYKGAKVFIGIHRKRFVVVDVASNDLWAKEYFDTVDQAIGFCRVNEFDLQSEEVNTEWKRPKN